MDENSSNRNDRHQTPGECGGTPSRINAKNSAPGNIIFKLQEIIDRENLERNQRKTP